MVCIVTLLFNGGSTHIFSGSLQGAAEIARLVIDYIHIRRIGKISKYLTINDTETLVHAFVTSRLSHLNGLLYEVGLPKNLIFRLQRTQNTAERLVTRSKPSSHNYITPVLQSLHWLPVEKRIQYKILLLTYNFRCLHARAPTYTSPTCLRLVAKICLNLGLQPMVRSFLPKLRSSANGPFVSATANFPFAHGWTEIEHSQWQLLNSGMNQYHLN